jgi:hypothetical protein
MIVEIRTCRSRSGAAAKHERGEQQHGGDEFHHVKNNGRDDEKLHVEKALKCDTSGQGTRLGDVDG